MSFVVGLARPQDVPAALRVWQAANAARGLAPSTQRVERVRQKLEDPDAVVLLGRLDDDLAAMALVERWRADGGTGPAVPGRGHISMVFVEPECWGRGLGATLLAELHRTVAAGRGWSRTTVWTRESNQRAQRLYAASGYEPTGQVAELPTGDRILELDRREPMRSARDPMTPSGPRPGYC